MILLSQGYLNNHGDIWEFPAINEFFSSACLKMLNGTVINIESVDDYDKYTLSLEYGETHKGEWSITNTFKIWFYETENGNTANVIVLLTEAIARLYKTIPFELKDNRGMGPEVSSYIVKIVRQLNKH